MIDVEKMKDSPTGVIPTRKMECPTSASPVASHDPNKDTSYKEYAPKKTSYPDAMNGDRAGNA